MIRYSIDEPPVITRSMELGFSTFKRKYDLNLIVCRNTIERPDTFQDTMHVVYHDGQKWIEYIYPCTSHAGLYYLQNPSRSAGVAILKHDHQYRSSFTIGMRSSGYECLERNSTRSDSCCASRRGPFSLSEVRRKGLVKLKLHSRLSLLLLFLFT